MSSRASLAALRINLSTLGENQRYVYMWTFTLRGVVAVRLASKMWNLLFTKVLRPIGFFGVRVYELHPGGHGLHVHFVTPTRFPVQVVRAAMKAGLVGRFWGRVHVRRRRSSAAHYVTKYVSKAARCGAFKGVRIWACHAFDKAQQSLVCNIVCDSMLGRIVRFIRGQLAGCDSSFIHDRKRQFEAYRLAWWHYALGDASEIFREVAGYPF